MATIVELIGRMLPGRSPRSRSRLDCPHWPPDAFAIAATFMEQSGSYARQRCDGWMTAALHKRISIDAAQWRKLVLPKRVSRAWKKLASTQTLELAARDEAWCQAVHYVLACADEASLGLGFSGDVTDQNDVIDLLYEILWPAAIADPTNDEHDRRATTLCEEVPPDVACVQPKARTSQVGCTLRTLSHHLALLPSASVVRTCWVPLRKNIKRPTAPSLNFLIVPFPFAIDGSCFLAGARSASGLGGVEAGYFTMKPRWLPSPQSLVAHFRSMVRSATRTVGRIDGVIVPELALSPQAFRTLSRELGRMKIDTFIAGVISQRRNELHAHFDQGRTRLTQSKHHRWRLDDRQIRRYQLGHVFDPQVRWWEDIDLGEASDGKRPIRDGLRAVNFVEIQPGTIACALICEDLARHDPVHPVVRSVGPNLVVSLLMDGPQLARRWPGQYASVLADDPGSAVLTLTCVGMLRRSVAPGEAEPRTIALWKDATGDARELLLPPGASGLILSINSRKTAEATLDGRSDNGATSNLSLGAVHAVKLEHPQAWAI
jgi:hypothetical protein